MGVAVVVVVVVAVYVVYVYVFVYVDVVVVLVVVVAGGGGASAMSPVVRSAGFCKAQEESAPMDLPKEREEGEAWHNLSAKTLSIQLLSW